MAEYALACLEGEGDKPRTDDELSNLLWYSQEATCHSDPNYYCEFQRLATPGFIAWIIRELQERRRADRDSEPVMPNFKKLARELVENLVDCGGLDAGMKGKYLKWTEKTCRAAMLLAALQEVKP